MAEKTQWPTWDDKEIWLHLGVHKTATTYTQRLLLANQTTLEQRGIVYIHHRQTRRELTIPIQTYNGQSFEHDMRQGIDKLLEAPVHYFKAIGSANARVVLLSDENLLGHTGHIVRSGILYSRKETFLARLASATPKQPTRILLTIRDYADFFSSVYGQYLHDVQPENFVPPNVFTASILRRKPSWTNLVRVIGKHFPSSQIEVW